MPVFLLKKTESVCLNFDKNECEEDLGGGETVIRMYCMKNIFFSIKGQMQKEKYASVHFVLENYRHISWIKSNKESVGYLVIFPHSVLTCKYPVI